MSNFWPCLRYTNHALCHTVIAYPLQPTLAPAMPTLWSDLLIFMTWPTLACRLYLHATKLDLFTSQRLSYYSISITVQVESTPVLFIWPVCYVSQLERESTGAWSWLSFVTILWLGSLAFPWCKKTMAFCHLNVTYQCASKMSNSSCRCILHALYN